jgi:hypothetical protein
MRLPWLPADNWREDFPCERCSGCHAERNEASGAMVIEMLSAAKHDSRGQQTDPLLRGGVTSSLFAAWTAVLKERLSMLLSKCLDYLVNDTRRSKPRLRNSSTKIWPGTTNSTGTPPGGVCRRAIKPAVIAPCQPVVRSIEVKPVASS